MGSTQLQVYRFSRHQATLRTAPLADGEKGTLQALEIAAQMVREDARNPALWRLVTRLVGDASGLHPAEQIDRAFTVARDGIRYQRDPRGTERVADMLSALCLFKLQGDCLVKSIFLATALALLGFAPFFVVVKQTPQNKNYHHVYVGLVVEGKYLALDPTPEDRPEGWEVPAYVRSYYPIFE